MSPRILTIVAVAATFLSCHPIAMANAEDRISVKQLDTIVAGNPLRPGGDTAAIVETIRAGGAEVGVLVMSRNRLHHHVAQDHVLYVARGSGIARLEDETGKVVSRTIGPGDILALPRGKKHGFAKSGAQDLVFLVIATPLPADVEETTFHE